MDDFDSAIDYLYSLGNEIAAMKLGTESLLPILESLGQPERQLRVVHVAGTNGKGSFCAMLSCVLRACNIQTGVYTSPHLSNITERIVLNGEPISKVEFVYHLNRIRKTIEGQPTRPSFFEHLTLLALDFFAKKHPELTILEVGMGGRLDATNVVTPLLSVITSIDFDHCQYLGNSLAEIATEKAGIIKQGRPVLVYQQHSEAEKVISAKTARLGAPILRPLQIDAEAHSDGRYRISAVGNLGRYDTVIGLRGIHQIECAAAVIRAAEYLADLGLPITAEGVCKGIKQANWPGRLESFRIDSRQILLDGAHNPAGIMTLRRFLDDWYADRKKILLFAAMRDKAVEEMLSLLDNRFESIILVRRNDPRSFNPEAYLSNRSLIAEGAKDALSAALQLAQTSALIVCCGSLHFIGELRELIMERQRCMT
ncbi:MAG: folylpolyglutamate synthase/dihydrofolate synthase family protein [Acidobacteriota bacterium]|nr:bifunctional folylpolyglutamate synthase/dihydrofolate synthase [Blastocatellia bacterium]MDW8413763.1 folylpolyglutamate synthase/dihydrofolate synthase family protein [Acidobacteriota bacterium]